MYWHGFCTKMCQFWLNPLVKICTLDQHNHCFCHRCCCCCCCCCPADVDVPGSENTGGLGTELIRLPHSSYSDPAQMLHQSRLCKLLEWLNMCINQSYFYIRTFGQKRNLLLFCISQMNVFLCICAVLSLTQYWMRKSSDVLEFSPKRHNRIMICHYLCHYFCQKWY